MATDAREHRHLKQALIESEAQLKAVLDCLPFDLWMIGLDGCYVMQNDLCRSVWGNIIGKRPEDIAPNSKIKALWLKNNIRALAGEVIKKEILLPVAGIPRYFTNIVSPIYAENKIIGIMGINYDITERKVAENAINQKNESLTLANQKLKQLSRSKDKMTAMISHELRTPLVTGLGYIDMLLKEQLGPLTSKMHQKMKIAQRNLKRLAELIDRVLKYQALLTQPSSSFSMTSPFNLAALIEEISSDFRDHLEQPDRVVTKIEDRLITVQGNQELLRIVIVNLLKNAIVHGGSDVSVAIETNAVTDNKVPVTIRDSGQGIDKEILDSVFDPFVKSRSDGYGLGLSLVQVILKAHQSETILKSNHQGTQVTFHLTCV